MTLTAVEIAKDLAVAAIQAQPAVVAQSVGGGNDAAALGKEVTVVFLTILNEIKLKVPLL